MSEGSAPPTPEVRGEVERAMLTDATRLGDVYRRIQEGQSDEVIAAQLGVSTKNFVWNHRVTIKALLEGDVPTAPSLAANTSRKVRSLLGERNLSAAATDYLNGLLAAMQQKPTDEPDSSDKKSAQILRVRVAMEILRDEPHGVRVEELFDLVTQVVPLLPDEQGTTKKGESTALVGFNYQLTSPIYAGWIFLWQGDVTLTSLGRDALSTFPEAATLMGEADDIPRRLGMLEADPPPTTHELAERIIPYDDDWRVRRVGRQLLESGLGSGTSLIDPSVPAWSPAVVEDLHRRYNEQMDESNRGFLEKLEDQLDGAPDATILLAAEIFAMLQMPLVNVGQRAKSHRMRRILSWLNKPRAPGPLLAYSWFQGSWHGGVGGNTLLWRAMADMVDFLREWWALSPERRAEALADPWMWKTAAESSVLTMPSSPELLKYLGFPTHFLPIVNRDQKRSIRDAFLSELGHDPAELDRDLFEITVNLQQQYGETIHYYRAPFKDRWQARKDNVVRAWLVRGSSVSGHNLVPLWIDEGYVSLPASTLEPIDDPSDRALIVAAVHDAFSGRAADYRRQKTDDYDRFLRMISPGDRVVTTADGIVYVGEIEGEPEWVPDSELPARLRRNVRWLTGDGVVYAELPEPLPGRLSANDDVTDLTDDLAVIESLIPPNVDEPTPPVVVTPPIAVPAMAELVAPTPEFADSLCMPLSWLDRLTRLTQRRRSVILFGPPGTGKTYLAQKLADHWTDAGNSDLVQFHPSVAYEDFIAGYRPVERDGSVVFELRQGPFMRLAERARDNPGVAHVLIIDEINRANLAKVFGELYFLLEYRNKAMTPLYGEEGSSRFTLPDNVFIIGTMNTADRSIALVDAAMRRRFAFISMYADEEPVSGVLRSWLAANELPGDAADLLDLLNARILDRDFRIGPSYLMQKWIHAEDTGLDDVWQTDLLPLLEEHHAGENVDVEARYGLVALRKELQNE